MQQEGCTRGGQLSRKGQLCEDIFDWQEGRAQEKNWGANARAEVEELDAITQATVISWGIGHSMAERMKNKEAMEIWKTYSSAWRRYFSDPDVAVVDLGAEFQPLFSEAVGMTGACFIQ